MLQNRATPGIYSSLSEFHLWADKDKVTCLKPKLFSLRSSLSHFLTCSQMLVPLLAYVLSTEYRIVKNLVNLAAGALAQNIKKKTSRTNETLTNTCSPVSESVFYHYVVFSSSLFPF